MSSSDLSPNLGLPFLAPAQAQKHVTHNEALGLLDLLVQLVVQDFAAQTPPASPTSGAVWALGAAPTGVWAGQAGRLAAWRDGAWVFVPPRAGWRATGLADGSLRIWSGSAWARMDMDNLDGVGIGTAHDATNRLAVAAPATLLTHAGTDHRLVLNKASVADTGSLLFQSGWSGRAELGLAGSDMFTLKVSADGSQWQDGLSVAPSTGQVSLPNGVQVTGQVVGTAVTQTPVDMTAGRLLKAGDAGILGTPPAAPADIGVTDNSIAAGAWRHAGAAFVTAGLPAALAASSSSYLFHHRRGPGNEAQMLLGEFAPNDADRTLWFRRRTGEAAAPWGGWKRVYDWGNILGTVSQSGGVPTGAIVQRGANANGEFVRFADGTQICTLLFNFPDVAVTTAAGAIFHTGTEIVWTFPASFVSTNHLACAASPRSGLPIWARARATGLGSASVRVFSPTSLTGSIFLEMSAIGRWF